MKEELETKEFLFDIASRLVFLEELYTNRNRRTTKQTFHLEDEQHLTFNNRFATSQLFIIRRVFLGGNIVNFVSCKAFTIPLFLSFVSFIPLRVDNVGYPVDRFRHAMIDSWLAWLRARVTRRNDAYQVPSPRLLEHQRSTTVTLQNEKNIYFFLLLSLDSTSATYLARVLATSPVTSAHHFVVNHHVDPV